MIDDEKKLHQKRSEKIMKREVTLEKKKKSEKTIKRSQQKRKKMKR